MRRLLLILYVGAALLLSGCQGNLFSSHRDMERLRPVQTMGFDAAGEELTVSVSAGLGAEDAPALVMSASGGGVEEAARVLQDYSPEDELFFAHVRYVLLGQSVTGDRLTALLDWVERCPSMRIDTNLLLLRGRAEEAVTAAMGERTDVTRRLASLEREELARGRHLFTLRQAAAGLLERGGSLVMTAAAVPAEGVVHAPDGEASALVPGGYAVIRIGGPTVFLTEEETLGAELLTGGVNGARATAEGCTLELISGEADPSLERGEDGAPAALLLRVRLTAGLMEAAPDTPEPDLTALEEALALQARDWLDGVLARSRELDCDFMDLARRMGTEESWTTLAELPVEIRVTAVIDRSYDRR